MTIAKLIEELRHRADTMNGALPVSADRNTHLLDWLADGHTHCQHGSKEWCEAYLHNARDTILSQDEALASSKEEIARLRKALAEAQEGHAAARQNFHTMQLAADALRKRAEAAEKALAAQEALSALQLRMLEEAYLEIDAYRAASNQPEHGGGR